MLRTVISNPIEREYEAWIMDAIDDYFFFARRQAALFAVSPSKEVEWPADEVIAVEGKLVGLQFKKPKLSRAQGRPRYDFSRLYWSFHQPAGQHSLLLRHTEICYSLPTFINRNYRRNALHHCLFWRPTNPTDLVAWYDNPSHRVRTEYRQLAGAPRWGLFSQNLLRCPVGRRLTREGLEEYLPALHSELREVAQEGRGSRRIYLIYIEME